MNWIYNITGVTLTGGHYTQNIMLVGGQIYSGSPQLNKIVYIKPELVVLLQLFSCHKGGQQTAFSWQIQVTVASQRYMT